MIIDVRRFWCLDQKYELRRPVYEEFLSILNTAYINKAPLIKQEESKLKL